MMDVYIFYEFIVLFILILNNPLFVFTIQPKNRTFTREIVSPTLLYELISPQIKWTFHSYLTVRWEMEKQLIRGTYL